MAKTGDLTLHVFHQSESEGVSLLAEGPLRIGREAGWVDAHRGTEKGCSRPGRHPHCDVHVLSQTQDGRHKTQLPPQPPESYS